MRIVRFFLLLYVNSHLFVEIVISQLDCSIKPTKFLFLLKTIPIHNKNCEYYNKKKNEISSKSSQTLKYCTFIVERLLISDPYGKYKLYSKTLGQQQTKIFRVIKIKLSPKSDSPTDVSRKGCLDRLI